MKPLPSILRVTDPIYRKRKFLSARHNRPSCLPLPRKGDGIACSVWGCGSQPGCQEQSHVVKGSALRGCVPPASGSTRGQLNPKVWEPLCVALQFFSPLFQKWMSEKEGDDLQGSLLWKMLECAVRWVHSGPVCTVALPVSYKMG